MRMGKHERVLRRAALVVQGFVPILLPRLKAKAGGSEKRGHNLEEFEELGGGGFGIDALDDFHDFAAFVN